MNIYVGNLPFDTTEEQIRGAFERFGRVSSARVISDQTTGKPRGFGFVTMPRLEDAEEAILGMNGQDMAGRRLIVNEARDRPDRPERSRFRDVDDDERDDRRDEVLDLFAKL